MRGYTDFEFRHRRRWFVQGYSGYIGGVLAIVAYASFTTPLSPSMVTAGVITGNPPLLLLILSSLATVPATVVLLTAAVVSLRRSFQWHGVLMLSGASVLGAGGALYIASFPVMLYYAEFVGITMLFIGLVNLSRLRAPSAHPAVQGRAA